MLWVIESLLDKLVIGRELGAKIQVMKKSVFLIAYVNEGGIPGISFFTLAR